MLARYKIYRGKRPVDSPLPAGVRQDTRKHTRHCLRPPAEIVTDYLAEPSDLAWEKFREGYAACLQARWSDDRSPFESLAELASRQPVFLGCSCPTAKNVDVYHCHTVLALEFMGEHYPALEIELP